MKPSKVKLLCNICGITCYSEVTFEGHLQGFNHRVNEMTAQAKVLRLCTDGECALCRASLNSSSVADSHYGGRRHARAVTAFLRAEAEVHGRERRVVTAERVREGWRTRRPASLGQGRRPPAGQGAAA